MAKYVLEFSPEYFATSLWSRNEAADDAFGWGPVDYDKLPLSAELVRQLKKFDDHCVGIIDWSDPGKGDIRPQSEAEEYYLTGVVKAIHDMGLKNHAVVTEDTPEYWGVNSMEELEKVENYLKTVKK